MNSVALQVAGCLSSIAQPPLQMYWYVQMPPSTSGLPEKPFFAKPTQRALIVGFLLLGDEIQKKRAFSIMPREYVYHSRDACM